MFSFESHLALRKKIKKIFEQMKLLKSRYEGEVIFKEILSEEKELIALIDDRVKTPRTTLKISGNQRFFNNCISEQKPCLSPSKSYQKKSPNS